MKDRDTAGRRPGPGSAANRRPDALREVMVLGGLELIDQRGLSLTFDSISYAKVFEYLRSEYNVRVTRGSVHERIWASQNDFRGDVLAESVAYFPEVEIKEAVLAVPTVGTGPAEFAKDLGSRVFPKVLQSEMSERFQSVKALACWFDDPRVTKTLHRLLDDRAELALADARDRFPSVLSRLGLRPRGETGLTGSQAANLFYSTMEALIDGGQLNYHAGSHDVTAPVGFLSTPATASDPWHVVSIGIKCLLDFLYELEDEPGRSTGSMSPSESTLRPPRRPIAEPHVEVASAPSSRRPRAQLRELVLTGAVELLLQDGPQLRPDLLSYSRVFAHLRETRGITVHRASVHHRIWESNDDFRVEVLVRSLAANAYPIPEVSEALLSVRPVMHPDGALDRHRTAHKVFRRASSTLSGMTAESVAYRRLLQIKAALVDQPDSAGKTALREAVAEAEQQRAAGNSIELQALVLDHGFRARPETGLTEEETLDLFEVLSMTTATGTMVNDLAGITSATRPTSLADSGGNGPGVEWTPLGVAMRSYFDQLYEVVPQI